MSKESPVFCLKFLHWTFGSVMDGTAGGQLTGADGVPVCLLSAAYNEIRKWQLTWYRVVFKTDCF